MSKEIGWGNPSPLSTSSKVRFHFFQENGDTLCRKYRRFAGEPELENDRDDHSDNCTVCMKKIKEYREQMAEKEAMDKRYTHWINTSIEDARSSLECAFSEGGLDRHDLENALQLILLKPNHKTRRELFMKFIRKVERRDREVHHD